MFFRSRDNTRRLKAHQIQLHSGGSGESPLTLDDKPYPISRLDTGRLLFGANSVSYLDANGSYYEILHRNSVLQVGLDNADDNNVVKVKAGQPVVVGSNMNKKASPAPFAYVSENGDLNSVVLSDAVYDDSVMGYSAAGKPNSYSQGLVKAGSSIHGGLFLRKDGQWGQPSVYTGSVSETMLSLQDTPASYQGNTDKYLRVSYANGGSVVFDAIDTSKVPESATNLYYTATRADTRITQKAGDRSLITIAAQQTITANEFVADSDVRLKEDITDLVGGLDTVAQLNPKSYTFKGNSKLRFGLISQEVERVLPQLVGTSGEFQTLNYIELVPFLVQAVKELKGQVDELRRQLALVEAK